MDEIVIPTDEVKKGFKDFINIERNTRIFFSGPFGVGKTRFLKDFFETNQSLYDVYHLFPISYQIHQNDDVIDLVKYDILVELLKKNSNIFGTNEVNGIKESSLLFFSWIKENYSTNHTLLSVISLGETLADLTPGSALFKKLGKSLRDLLEIDEKFQNFKNEYKLGERGIVEKYEQAIREKISSEPDYISALVKEKISQNKGARKSVLVLDDMDRIDPEHIFRILNILSSHFDQDHENKFGFDTVVFVADHSNIKHIFNHKYGFETDFSGYMDKFYTISPYYFDNKRTVLSFVEEIVKRIKNEEPNLNPAIGDSGYIKLFLEHIFSKATDAGAINLRQLLKSTNFQLLELKKGSYYEDSFSDNFQKLFDKAIRVAIHSFSNTETFIEKIKIIKQYKSKSAPRMPFNHYSLTMLKSLGIIPNTDSFDVHWNNFHLIKNQGSRNSFEVATGTEEGLFYDLLVEYIKDKKYIKNNPSDYER